MTNIPFDGTRNGEAAAESVDVTPANLRTMPGIPPLARLAFRALLKIRHGSILMILPDGRKLRFQGSEPGEHAVMVIRDFGLTRRFFASGDLGAAEAFLDGMWDSPNVTAFLQFFLRNSEALQDKLMGVPIARFVSRLGHLMRRNSKRGSKRNIEYHYDLGNNFYRRWLDPTMTYSSARFEHAGQDLSAAQINKYRSLAESIDLKPEHHLLEIGSGWGGFAEYAASEIGCSVTGVTISKEQLAFARERMEKKGLTDKVDIRYQDYRDIDERFDRIASIEMFEAVGEEYWPAYFDKVRNCLKPGGKAGLQIITIADRSFAAYRKRADFIQRYIFPGGMLPSPSVLRQQVARAGLTWVGNRDFGLDYAETLNQWRSRFRAAWPDIQRQGFDERFRRMWEYYLSYCEAGFRAGNIDVTQVTLARP
ncbi:cyclopropane-fatty-acyl-phospholipid synthase family protein [Parvibaculum sp.]|uniref:SAM-dependent methyltransferase n=1 Tax=Parvibaculum sp. TaxID=2024848 RepID=UPI00273139D7|nr:cyclopropane-fatty-acyl-phospholipid synthase family protein [Parvibaculum sp.]MDP1628174.1 cyclopropane-fatty-acyl-phospholipid synthase family protein [Parvibaculum sp.]MDP2151173.1 cyclopropane-fatty-acyl-phospholipid synthase family protein [Parvibaculum sp.]MDP3326914.1 cyclopropane-fatty-acyl-phospholipid synthase family protein [Parvibaculum sp.]